MPQLTPARFILLGAFAALILMGAAGFALRDQIYQTFQDPGEPFQTYTPPDPPEYASPEGWYVQQDFADEDQPAVFYVHSTTYSGGANWNAELDKPIAIEGVTNLDLPNYAAPFGDSGALHAPRYRQAALYAFLNNREDGVLARLFAFGDIAAAFDRFLERAGPNRPIVLAGAGQGGLHVIGLLSQRIAPDPDLRARLVAAYAIEAAAPLDLFAGPLAGLPPCEGPESVRCVIAYSAAEREETRRLRILTERIMSWSPGGGLAFVEGRGLVCVNPVLGSATEDYAPARLHRGGVSAEGLSLDDRPALQTQQSGVQCDDGVLIIEPPRSRTLRRPSRLAEDHRIPPFNLFYEDLRLDALRRSEVLAGILAEERRWAPPLGAPEDIREAPVVPIPDRAGGG